MLWTRALLTVIQYSGLVTVMYKLAIDVCTVTNFVATTVTLIDPFPPATTLSTGETVRGGLLIAADGYRSLACDAIEQDHEGMDAGTPSGTAVYLSPPLAGFSRRVADAFECVRTDGWIGAA